jgi:transposase
MKPPIFVRMLSKDERERRKTKASLKCSPASSRSQMLLASSRGEHVPQIARNLNCGQQTVRDAIHNFNARGPDALTPGSSRPKRTRAAFDEKSAEVVREMLHCSPREFGMDTSLWTLEMAAEVSFEEGLMERCVSGETIRATLARLLGVPWQRAKRWITSLDPLYERKRRRDRLMNVAEADPEWAVGFEYECWWSRLALSTLSSWAEEGKPLRLTQWSVAKDDPDPNGVRRADVAEARGWSTRERHKDPVSPMVR